MQIHFSSHHSTAELNLFSHSMITIRDIYGRTCLGFFKSHFTLRTLRAHIRYTVRAKFFSPNTFHSVNIITTLDTIDWQSPFIELYSLVSCLFKTLSHYKKMSRKCFAFSRIWIRRTLFSFITASFNVIALKFF